MLPDIEAPAFTMYMLHSCSWPFPEVQCGACYAWVGAMYLLYHGTSSGVYTCMYMYTCTVAFKVFFGGRTNLADSFQLGVNL